ncbi:MAG: hypothetical protein ABIZ04_21455 [Opitutus sp.]
MSNPRKPYVLKKPRLYNSAFDGQPLHVKAQLQAWLTTGGAHGIGISYDAASHRLESEFGLKVSPSAVQKFYHRTFRPEAKGGDQEINLAIPSQSGAITKITISIRTENPNP